MRRHSRQSPSSSPHDMTPRTAPKCQQQGSTTQATQVPRPLLIARPLAPDQDRGFGSFFRSATQRSLLACLDTLTAAGDSSLRTGVGGTGSMIVDTAAMSASRPAGTHTDASARRRSDSSSLAAAVIYRQSALVVCTLGVDTIIVRGIAQSRAPANLPACPFSTSRTYLFLIIVTGCYASRSAACTLHNVVYPSEYAS
jgi:hypothetical protein